MWSGLSSFATNPMGIHWTGIVFGLGAVLSMGYWTADFLVVQRILTSKDIRSAEMAPITGAGFKMFVPLIVMLPGLLRLAVLPMKLTAESAVTSVFWSDNFVSLLRGESRNLSLRLAQRRKGRIAVELEGWNVPRQQIILR